MKILIALSMMSLLTLLPVASLQAETELSPSDEQITIRIERKAEGIGEAGPRGHTAVAPIPDNPYASDMLHMACRRIDPTNGMIGRLTEVQ